MKNRFSGLGAASRASLIGIIIAFTGPLANAAESELMGWWPTTYKDGNLVFSVKPTAEELTKFKAELAGVTHEDLKGYERTILFDCRVLKAMPNDESDQLVTVVEPIDVFAGRKYLKRHRIKLTSPKLEDNGVQLEENRRYRIRAMRRVFKGKTILYIWNGSILALDESTETVPHR